MSGARPRSIDESESTGGTPSHALVVGVISGGDPLVEAECSAVRAADVIIAADSGLDLAAAADLRVDTAIGDFDSATAAAVARAEKDGTEIIRHSSDKDETDLELALIRAIDSSAARIVVVGLAGGRPDHALSSLLLLADPRWSTATVVGHVGDAIVTVVGGGVAASPTRHRFDDAARGELVSLIPVGGDAHGVSTVGMRWPLIDETLSAHSPRGMSNVIESEVAEVSLRAGTLLAFQPSRAPAPDGDR